jgi:hypothetical protein
MPAIEEHSGEDDSNDYGQQ